MFIDIPASPPPVISANHGNEMVIEGPINNQVHTTIHQIYVFSSCYLPEKHDARINECVRMFICLDKDGISHIRMYII